MDAAKYFTDTCRLRQQHIVKAQNTSVSATYINTHTQISPPCSISPFKHLISSILVHFSTPNPLSLYLLVLSPLLTCNQFPATGPPKPASLINPTQSIPNRLDTACLCAAGTAKPAGCSCNTNT